MPPTRRDKTTGLPLPSPVVPATTLCFRMTIPNALEYRTALKGVLSDLGRAWTWTQTVGEDNNAAHEAAALWRAAVAQSTFTEICETDMSCDDIADCIESSPDVQTVINNMITTVSLPGVISVPGQPLTPAQYLSPLNPMEDCDYDVLWSQTVKFVEYATNAGTDLLNKIETFSNSIEAATFIEVAPIIGSIMDEIQLDKMLQLMDWVAETAGEFYAAANNEIAREQLACDIFCQAKPDCGISIALVWDVLNERLGGVLSPGDITTFPQFVDALLTIVGNEDIALDLWLVSLTGFAKFLGYFGVRGLDETLRLVLLLAADEPSNNWETLCPECSSNDWCWLQDTTVDVSNMELSYTDAGYPYQTTFVPGVGIQGDRGGFLDENIPKVVLPNMRTITGFSFTIDVTGSATDVAAYMFIDGTFVDTQPIVSGVQTVTFSFGPIPAEYVMFGVDRVGLDRSQVGSITSWRMEGEGSNPFGPDNCP